MMMITSRIDFANEACAMRRPAKGFTLIELLIVVAIVGILVAAAVASYGFATVKANRAAGKGCVMEQAQLAERFYTTNLTYVGVPAHACVADPQISGNYTIGTAAAATATTFSYQAVPTGSQATRDTLCGTLGINQVGTKTVTGTGTPAECW